MLHPAFYDPSQVGVLLQPNIQAAVDAGIALRLPAALNDGMSSVAVPGIDFDALAELAYQRHRSKGLRFTKTTEAIG